MAEDATMENKRLNAREHLAAATPGGGASVGVLLRDDTNQGSPQLNNLADTLNALFPQSNFDGRRRSL
jgi:hypothetical protein